MSVAIATLTAVAFYFTQYQKVRTDPVADASTGPAACIPPQAFKFIGPEKSIAGLEAESLKEMKEHPNVPQVPFGYGNEAWVELKSHLQPGDTLHEFKTDVTGGYLVVRHGCVVDQFPTWIR